MSILSPEPFAMEKITTGAQESCQGRYGSTASYEYCIGLVNIHQ